MKSKTLPSEPKRSRVAVFDWDDTLHKGFTILPWCDFLYSRGLFERRSIREIKRLFTAYHHGTIGYAELCAATALTYAEGIAGSEVEQAVATASHFVQNGDTGLHRFAVRILRLLQKLGIGSVVVSGAPLEVLQEYAKKYPVSRMFGLEISRSDGLFAAKVRANYGLRRKKAAAMREILGTSKVLFAVGNSAEDFPLLRSAEVGILLGKRTSMPSRNLRSDFAYCTASSIEQFIRAVLQRRLEV